MNPLKLIRLWINKMKSEKLKVNFLRSEGKVKFT